MAYKHKRSHAEEGASPATPLEAVIRRVFATPRFANETRATDETGLVLREETEPDVRVNLLAFQRCSVCGRPARSSVYDLKRRERTLLCGSCRPPSAAKG